MSNPEYSKNDRAASVVGRRNPGGESFIAIDQPAELGYWCPICRVGPEIGDGDLNECLEWSEYAGFLWCSTCNYDYPSALCVRLEGHVIPQRGADGSLSRPSHRWGGRDYAVQVFLDTVRDAKGVEAAP